MNDAAIPTLVLGGTGYVAGEVLRLLVDHPRFRVAGVASNSQAGEAVEKAFPQLAGCYPGLAFQPLEVLANGLEAGRPAALVSAAPHGASAAAIEAVLAAAEGRGVELRVVDLSADFRFADPAAYQAVYGHPHPAPARQAEFVCAVPELAGGRRARHACQPGCFVTATLLASVPLLAAGVIEPRVLVSGVTGSTGAGRNPTPTTQHSERRSNLFGYNPLGHRHAPEMEALAREASGVEAEYHFAPQGGPFARGIYATVWGTLAGGATLADARAALAAAYADSPFVHVLEAPPQLKDVVGTNRCHLGLAADRGTLLVFSTLDNLVKGAAGGAIQWLNRLFGLPEATGLVRPALGWI